MRILRLNLKELGEVLSKPAREEYAIAVIDNAPPSTPRLPLIAENFIWIRKVGPLPTQREELERLFSNYGLKVKKDQPIAVFHHHDLPQPYLQFKEKIECYEFSHIDSVAYKSFLHGDANLISHLLSRTFHQFDKIILVKTGISIDAIKRLKKHHWIFSEFEKLEGFDAEESLIYFFALELAGHEIIPDPKRYRPEVHDELIKSGVAVDQYAIPSLFKVVEIETGTELDEKVKRKIGERKKNWEKEIERLQKEREAELARMAQEKESKERGELLAEEARTYIDSIAPSLGFDYTDEPLYPPTRKDIAVVRRMVENGSSYGYDIVYLVWKKDEKIKAKKLIDSASTKDYIHVRSVEETKRGIKIKVWSGGSYSGKAWEETLEIPFSQLDETEDEPEKLDEFQRFAQGLRIQAEHLPDAAKLFIGAMAEQMARVGMAISGKKTKGEEILESKFSKEMEKLKKKHPNLSEISRLSTIAEVYSEDVVKETFSLLQIINDSRTANQALHIFGEMAMLRNDPSIYLRLINLLKRKNDGERLEILLDDNVEFMPDEVIEYALKKYE